MELSATTVLILIAAILAVIIIVRGDALVGVALLLLALAHLIAAWG